jgi:hypothetical protein
MLHLRQLNVMSIERGVAVAIACHSRMRPTVSVFHADSRDARRLGVVQPVGGSVVKRRTGQNYRKGRPYMGEPGVVSPALGRHRRDRAPTWRGVHGPSIHLRDVRTWTTAFVLG